IKIKYINRTLINAEGTWLETAWEIRKLLVSKVLTKVSAFLVYQNL
ncbi:hypothetical protein SAMN04488500_1251, partial [Sporomusa malonica]